MVSSGNCNDLSPSYVLTAVMGAGQRCRRLRPSCPASSTQRPRFMWLTPLRPGRTAAAPDSSTNCAAFLVVVLAPRCDVPPRIQAQKPIRVQAFLPQPSVGTLDKRILRGFAWLDKLQPGLPLLAPSDAPSGNPVGKKRKKRTFDSPRTSLLRHGRVAQSSDAPEGHVQYEGGTGNIGTRGHVCSVLCSRDTVALLW